MPTLRQRLQNEEVFTHPHHQCPHTKAGNNIAAQLDCPDFLVTAVFRYYPDILHTY